jgi:hypothetical protein
MTYQQQPDPQPTHGQPPVKAPKHKLTAPTWLIAISITLVALCCIGVGILAVVGVAGTDLDDPGRDIRPETAEPVGDGEPADEPDAVYHEPDAEDFELTVKTLSKECFGSAGCLIDFRIELGYVHTGGDLDPAITYEVTYEISGGESSYINTLTVTGDQYSTEEMESVSTASDVELGVEITDVSEL